MLWAKLATHHGWLIFLVNGTQQLKNVSYIGCYVGLALIRRNKLSRRTIGVNLVLTTHHEHDHHFLLPPTRSCCVSRCPPPALAATVLFSEAHHLAGILFPPIPCGLSREGFPRRQGGTASATFECCDKGKNNRSPGFRVCYVGISSISKCRHLGKVHPTWESYKIERNAPKNVGTTGRVTNADIVSTTYSKSITHHPIHRTHHT